VYSHWLFLLSSNWSKLLPGFICNQHSSSFQLLQRPPESDSLTLKMEALCVSKLKRSVTTCCESGKVTIIWPLTLVIQHRHLFMSGLYLQLGMLWEFSCSILLHIRQCISASDVAVSLVLLVSSSLYCWFLGIVFLLYSVFYINSYFSPSRLKVCWICLVQLDHYITVLLCCYATQKFLHYYCLMIVYTEIVKQGENLSFWFWGKICSQMSVIVY